MTNKELNIELEGAPNIRYQKFFEKFKEIDTLEVANWNGTHLLAYFCKKYKEQYQTNYKFKFNSTAPSKCFEVFQIKKLSCMLTSQPILLKEYIDWIYLNKVVKAKRKLTSISFMTNEGVVNEYKLNVLLSNNKNSNIDRSTPLPENYKSIFVEAGLDIKTYGDLAFLSQMNPLSDSIALALQKIEVLGFDKNILGKIV